MLNKMVSSTAGLLGNIPLMLIVLREALICLVIGFPLELGVGMIVAVPLVSAMSENSFGDMYHQIGTLVWLIAVH